MKFSRFAAGIVLAAIAGVLSLLIAALPARAVTANGPYAYVKYSGNEYSYFDDWRSGQSSPDDWLLIHDGNWDNQYIYTTIDYRDGWGNWKWGQTYQGPSGADRWVKLPDLKDGWYTSYRTCRGSSSNACGDWKSVHE
jgi:hypothetical protein